MSEDNGDDEKTRIIQGGSKTQQSSTVQSGDDEKN